MAKLGTRVKSSHDDTWWRRGLMLAASTILAAFAFLQLDSLDTAAVDESIQLSRLPDGDLEPRLRTLIRRGATELSMVVDSLGASRDALRRAALVTLHQEIDSCSHTATREHTEQLDRIARLLAAQSGSFDVEALSLATALAERITALPVQAGIKSDRLRNCHVVLAANAQQRIHDRAPSSGDTPEKSAPSSRKTTSANKTRDGFQVVLSPLAGGGLDVTPSDTKPRRLSDQLIRQARPLRAPSLQSQSPTLPAPVKFVAAEPIAERGPIVAGQNRGDTISRENEIVEHDADGSKEAAVAHAEATPIAGDAPREVPRDLAKLLELERQVRAGDPAQSAGAKTDMTRLGIDQAQLNLARGAADRDPNVRREVVEALARIESVDSRGWLLWLSHDRDAEVRRAAITLLATSSDPELKKRVRQAAENDPDPRVRQQARAAAMEPR